MYRPSRRRSIASFRSGLRTFVLPETLQIFSKTSTKTSSLLISAVTFTVSRRTVIWKLSWTNIRWPPTSHFSTNGNFTLYEQSKNAGWGTFRAGSPFSSHSSHSPLRPLCKVTHFFFAQTISPNPQWEAARTLGFQRNHYIVLLVIFFHKSICFVGISFLMG